MGNIKKWLTEMSPFYRDEECGHLIFFWTPHMLLWRWRIWRDRPRYQLLGLDRICHHWRIRFYESSGVVFSFKDGVSTKSVEKYAYATCRDCIHTLGIVPLTEEVIAEIKRAEERDIAFWSMLGRTA
jgi:hypothetical protein